MSAIGTYGENLYQQVLPLHGPDVDGLARDYIGAIAQPFVEVDELVRDTPEGSGWSVILDADGAPSTGLYWLAQLAGVTLRQPKWLLGIVNWLEDPSFEEGFGGWASGGIGTTLTRVQGATTHGSWYLRIDITSPGTFEFWGPSKPIIEGRRYTFSMDVTHRTVTADPIQLEMHWLIGGLSTSSDVQEITGTGRVALSAVAPVGAQACHMRIGIPSGSDGDRLDFDAMRFVEGTSTEYVDRTFDGFTYPPGSPGSTITYVDRLENDAEWAVYARDAIKRQGGKQRGTVDAILSAAEDTLTYSRTARILERVGGNAWALELITRPSETPDPAATLAAATRQKPAGMSLSHTMTEGLLIDEDAGGTIDTAGGTIDSPT